MWAAASGSHCFERRQDVVAEFFGAGERACIGPDARGPGRSPRRDLIPPIYRDDLPAHWQRDLKAQPVQLRDGAIQLLRAVTELGHSQSLLSLCPHSTLLREVEEAGIGHFFERIDGRTGPPGGIKAAALAAHLDALGLSSEPQRVLVIGDAIDDADAALVNGALAVLHTGGLHHPAKLAASGYPLADSLDEALALGLRLACEPAPAR